MAVDVRRRTSHARWVDRGLAVVFGVLPALAFPEPSIWILGVVGLVPLFWMTCNAPTCSEALWRVWFGGIGFFIAVHHWLVPVTGPFVLPLAMALALLWIPWGGILWALFGTERNGPRLVCALLLVPSAWVVAEYLRSWEHLGGPWGLLGATQWQNHALLHVVSVGGVWLLSFLLGACNVTVAVAFLPRVGRQVRVVALGSAVLLIALASGSAVILPDSHSAEVFAVAGVQSGVMHDKSARFESHVELTRGLIGEDLDLVIWAESSVAFDLQPGSARLDRLRRLSEEVDAPILVNVDSRRGEGGIFKSSVLIDSEGIADRYDKMRLVPFGEYVPVRPLFGWVNELTDAADEDRRRGDSLAVMEVDGVSFGPLVCFESAFPDLSRRLADRGADLIVVQSATTTFQDSWAQPQHASLAAVRAAESGRPMVHAAVSGVSAVFAGDGRRLAWLGSDTVGTWRANPRLAAGTTVYVRIGDWVPIICVLALVVGMVPTGLRAARRRAAWALLLLVPARRD